MEHDVVGTVQAVEGPKPMDFQRLRVDDAILVTLQADRVSVGNDGELIASVSADGQLYWAGCAEILGVEHPSETFVRYKSLGDGVRITQIALGGAGTNHALLLTTAGTVLAVGNGENGVLGLGNEKNQKRPVPVPLDEGRGGARRHSRVVCIAVSRACSAAVTAAGHVFTWGKEAGSGQTGLQSKQAGGGAINAMHGGVKGDPHPVFWRRVPTRVWAFVGHACQIVLGESHTAVRCSSGEVYCFGSSKQGQCGLRLPLLQSNPCPRLVVLPKSAFVEDLAAGSNHTLALTRGGKLYGWGSNRAGALGVEQRVVAQASSLANEISPVRHIVAGQDVSVIQTVDGAVYCSGTCGASRSTTFVAVTLNSTEQPEWSAAARLICFATSQGIGLLGAEKSFRSNRTNVDIESNRSHSFSLPQCVMGDNFFKGDDVLALLTLSNTTSDPRPSAPGKSRGNSTLRDSRGDAGSSWTASFYARRSENAILHLGNRTFRDQSAECSFAGSSETHAEADFVSEFVVTTTTVAATAELGYYDPVFRTLWVLADGTSGVVQAAAYSGLVTSLLHEAKQADNALPLELATLIHAQGLAQPFAPGIIHQPRPKYSAERADGAVFVPEPRQSMHSIALHLLLVQASVVPTTCNDSEGTIVALLDDALGSNDTVAKMSAGTIGGAGGVFELPRFAGSAEMLSSAHQMSGSESISFTVNKQVELVGALDFLPWKVSRPDLPAGGGLFGSVDGTHAMLTLKNSQQQELAKCRCKLEAHAHHRASDIIVPLARYLFAAPVILVPGETYRLEVEKSGRFFGFVPSCARSRCEIPSAGGPADVIFVPAAASQIHSLVFNIPQQPVESCSAARRLSAEAKRKIEVPASLADLRHFHHNLRQLSERKLATCDRDKESGLDSDGLLLWMAHVRALLHRVSVALLEWPLSAWFGPTHDRVLPDLRCSVEICLSACMAVRDYLDRHGCSTPGGSPGSDGTAPLLVVLEQVFVAVSQTYAVGFNKWCPTIGCQRTLLLYKLRSVLDPVSANVTDVVATNAILELALERNASRHVGSLAALFHGDEADPVFVPAPANGDEAIMAATNESDIRAAATEALESLHAQYRTSSGSDKTSDVRSEAHRLIRAVLEAAVGDLPASLSQRQGFMRHAIALNARAARNTLHALQAELIALDKSVEGDGDAGTRTAALGSQELQLPIAWDSSAVEGAAGIKFSESDTICASSVGNSTTVGMRARVAPMENGVHMWKVTFVTNPGSPGGLGVVSYGSFVDKETLLLRKYDIVFTPERAAGGSTWIWSNQSNIYDNGKMSRVSVSFGQNSTITCFLDLRPGQNRFLMTKSALTWSPDFWDQFADSNLAKLSHVMFENVEGPVVPVAFSPWFGSRVKISEYRCIKPCIARVPTLSRVHSLHDQVLEVITDARAATELSALAGAAQAATAIEVIIPFVVAGVMCGTQWTSLLERIRAVLESLHEQPLAEVSGSRRPENTPDKESFVTRFCAPAVLEEFVVQRWTYSPPTFEEERRNSAGLQRTCADTERDPRVTHVFALQCTGLGAHDRGSEFTVSFKRSAGEPERVAVFGAAAASFPAVGNVSRGGLLLGCGSVVEVSLLAVSREDAHDKHQPFQCQVQAFDLSSVSGWGEQSMLVLTRTQVWRMKKQIQALVNRSQRSELAAASALSDLFARNVRVPDTVWLPGPGAGTTSPFLCRAVLPEAAEFHATAAAVESKPAFNSQRAMGTILASLEDSCAQAASTLAQILPSSETDTTEDAGQQGAQTTETGAAAGQDSSKNTTAAVEKEEDESDAEIIERRKVELTAELKAKYPSIDGLLAMGLPIATCMRLAEHGGNSDAVADYYFGHMEAEIKRAANLEKQWVSEARQAKLKVNVHADHQRKVVGNDGPSSMPGWSSTGTAEPLPQSIVVSGAGFASANGLYRLVAKPGGSPCVWKMGNALSIAWRRGEWVISQREGKKPLRRIYRAGSHNRGFSLDHKIPSPHSPLHVPASEWRSDSPAYAPVPVLSAGGDEGASHKDEIYSLPARAFVSAFPRSVSLTDVLHNKAHDRFTKQFYRLDCQDLCGSCSTQRADARSRRTVSVHGKWVDVAPLPSVGRIFRHLVVGWGGICHFDEFMALACRVTGESYTAVASTGPAANVTADRGRGPTHGVSFDAKSTLNGNAKIATTMLMQCRHMGMFLPEGCGM
eukprot:INCI12823.2.p1 GENE.INCI12823.2~~INCI12823.2.p1  ORF type:complete len:2383 (-),score=379.67 INCI12823.2:913-7473(-)